MDCSLSLNLNPRLKEKHLAQWKLSQHRLQLRLVSEGFPSTSRSQTGDCLKGCCGYAAAAQPCCCRRWGASICGNQRQRETHSPGAKPIMCEARATFAYYFWRGNPLNTLPPPNPRLGDACGGSPGDAPSWAGCSASAEVLSEEGCWTRRWLPADPIDGLAPGVRQKCGPPCHSLCYLLIDSSCQRLFAVRRPSGRRGRGGLGRNGNSSAQEVDCVSFIFTKG